MTILNESGWNYTKLSEALPGHSRRSFQRAWVRISNQTNPKFAVCVYDVLRASLTAIPPAPALKKRTRTEFEKYDKEDHDVLKDLGFAQVSEAMCEVSE